MLRVAEQYSATDTGRQRPANEDSMLARAPLFVVADGMGGAQAGEVASRIAVEAFRRGLDDHAVQNPERSLVARALEANTQIHELSESNAEQAGMGTTLTAAYVGEREVSVAHVGDSRAYLLREGELTRLTDDHSLVDELIRQGKLTPEEAEGHPQRSIITRALGPESFVEVDTLTHPARAGDVYLLCSDGLTTMISEADVAEIMLANERLDDAGEALLAAANEAGGRDNITTVLFRLEEAGAGGASAEHTTITHPPAQSALDEEDTSTASHSLTDTPPGRTGSASAVKVRRPRQQTQTPPARRRRWRRLGFPLALVVVLGMLLAGGYLATQSVYFISTNSRGLVTIYSGLPYELPGNLKLYTQYYVSGVPAASVALERRNTLLDHSLRSRGDASDLVRSLERGQLGGQLQGGK